MLPSQGFFLVTNLWRKKKGDCEPSNRLLWRKNARSRHISREKKVKLAIFRPSVHVTSPVYSGVWNFVFLLSLNSSQIWLSPLAPLATVLGHDFLCLFCLLCPVDFLRKTSGTIAGSRQTHRKRSDEAPGIQEAMLVELASLQKHNNNNNNSCCSCHENSPQSLAGCGGDCVRASLLHLLVS
jgi:hypothetical protein